MKTIFNSFPIIINWKKDEIQFSFLFFSLLRKMREKVVSDFLEMNLDVYMQNYQILSKVRSFCYTFPQ